MPQSAPRTVADQLADMCRASPDGGQHHLHNPCDKFLYGFKGAPQARQRRAPARRDREGRELAERESVN